MAAPWPAALLIAAALASLLALASALPVPPSGRFPYDNAPDSITGAWKGVAASTEPVVVLADTEGGGHISLRQPSSGADVITTLVNYTSYICLDDHTFLTVQEGISYPSMTRVKQCSIMFINATHRAVNSLPFEGGNCPNTPWVGFALAPSGAFVSSNVYEYLPGVLDPPPGGFICRNGTTPQVPAAAVAPPTPPPAAPPFPKQSRAGGPATAQGMWYEQNVVQLITGRGYYVAAHDPATSALSARRAAFLGHSCDGPDAYTATSEQFTLYINTTSTPPVTVCQRGQLVNGTHLDVAMGYSGPECPATATQGTETCSMDLAQQLTGVTTVTCGKSTVTGAAAAARRGAVAATAAAVVAALFL